VVAILVATGLGGCTSIAPAPISSANATTSPVGADWNLSKQALEQLYTQYVESLQGVNMLDHPVKPQLVRFVSSQEWAAAQVSCLEQAGFGATVNAQGGVTYDDIPQAQASAQRSATADCEAKYAIDPRVNMQLPRSRAEKQYNFLVTSVAPCVEKQGFNLSKAPSMQTWLEQYYANGRAWNPFDEAAAEIATGSPQLDDLYRSCPTMSTDVYPALQ
jgi:hypothetical protein